MNRLLVVEDEPVPRLLLGKILQKRGFEVRAAAGVQEAIEIGAEFRPHVLLADWLLKDDFTGGQVAETLREADPALRVIFISGLPRDALEPKVRHLHPCRVLEKPVQPDELTAIIQAELNTVAVQP